MSLNEDITDGISSVLNATWNSRSGQVVPTTDDVALVNGAVTMEAVFLYADLFDSTILAQKVDKSVAAKIVRAYLQSMSKLIEAHDGHIRSFDGDRVMGVFIGDSKNSNAAKCAVKMKWAVEKILRPKVESQFSSIATVGYKLRHCVGVDRGEVMIVRGGVRKSSDLVFIGGAPNIAAKLSGMRSSPSYNTYITKAVYSRLNEDAKFNLEKTVDMWTPVNVTLGGNTVACYKSGWQREP